MEKGENADLLLFPKCFLLYLREKSSFSQQLICRLQMLFGLVISKTLLFGKGLKGQAIRQELITIIKFLCPRINRSGCIDFALSVGLHKALTQAITFECKVIKLSYFTCVFLVVRRKYHVSAFISNAFLAETALPILMKIHRYNPTTALSIILIKNFKNLVGVGA